MKKEKKKKKTLHRIQFFGSYDQNYKIIHLESREEKERFLVWLFCLLI